MSRSGYSDDCDDNWSHLMWRGAVKSSLNGKRGQAFLRETLAALDALPEKKLVTQELEAEGTYCTLGAVGKARGMDLQKIDPEDHYVVAEQFDIANALAREIMFMNDEGTWAAETPEQRWHRMRNWVAAHILEDAHP